MSAHLDELYLEWLYGQVCSVKRKDPRRTYWNVFKILFTKEFVWIVPNDDNRIQDGVYLRNEFLKEKRFEIPDTDPDWLHLGCSMLELFVGLARRLAFETNSDITEWFWELLENLDLNSYNDRVDIPRERVEEIMDRVIWRTYRPNGRGGLFPLKNPEKDQRDVELWYQLSAYIIEQELI